MRDRRSFLSTMIACFSMTPWLSWGAALGPARTNFGLHRRGASLGQPSPVIDGLLGEYLVPGTTGRLCLFGSDLHHVEALVFQDAAIGARPIMTSEHEIMLDITAPVNLDIGKHRFLIKTKDGESRAGGDIVVIFARASGASASPGSQPQDTPESPSSSGFPCTPGFPGQRPCTVEQYYNDRPTIAGIGASLL